MHSDSFRARFDAKVMPVPEAGCWLWTAGTDPAGYGRILSPQRRVFAAHRLSWELHRGPIPAGMCVCHKCDTPGCVNPDHLFLGTHAENAADMIAKGRHLGRKRRGEATASAKLTVAQVLAIRAHPGSQKQIAREFGISPTSVCYIQARRNWGWLQ